MYRRGLPITRLAQTLVDLAGAVDEGCLEVAIDSAQHRYPLAGQWLQEHLDSRDLRGRHGVGGLKALLAARTGQAPESPLETRVRRALRRHRLPHPVTQHEVFDEQGTFVMRVDLAWPDERIALHVDGYEWHGSRSAFDKDARQRTRLAELDWVQLVVTSETLADRTWLGAVRSALEKRGRQLRLAW